MPIMRRYEKNAPGFSHISFTGAGAPSVTVFSNAAAPSAATATNAARQCCFIRAIISFPIVVCLAVLVAAALR